MTIEIGPGLVDPGQVMVDIFANASDSKTLGGESFLLCLLVYEEKLGETKQTEDSW